MASPFDSFERVRRMLAEPAVLRQIREATDVSRRLSGLGVASNLERFTKVVPSAAQLPVLNVGSDVTRLLAGSSAVTAWAEAQNTHRKIAELMKPKVWAGVPAPPVLAELQRLSDQLTIHTSVLARFRLPHLLDQATADSVHGWRMIVDSVADRPAAGLGSVQLAGTYTVGASVSARLIRPTP